jgi:hypothetical protein
MISATRNATIALALMLPGTAFASSDAAWSQFAKDVEQKCTAASGEIFRKPMVAVDPTGTESYGVAIVYGRSKEAKGPAAVICVMDKKTGKVEIGTELGKEVVRVRKPKPEGAQNQKADQGQKAKQGNSGSQDDDGDDDGQ